MPQIKRYVIAAGTFAVAMGIGFVMQNSVESAPDRTAADTTPLELDQIILTSALPVPTASLSPAGDPSVVLAQAEPEGEATDVAAEPAGDVTCGIRMTAAPVAGAMVDLALSAPCLPNERLALHHNGMMITEITGPEGDMHLTVPALAEQAVFIAAFATGDGAVASAVVPELQSVDRAVVQWTGQSGLELHALEYGATYGEPGHVWADAARDAAAVASGQGGFLMRFGAEGLADAQMAHVYTFPTGSAPRDGIINLSVEAEVTADNCGKEIEAQSLQVSAGKGLQAQGVTLFMPGCDAIGDFLVLKNLLNDLKVAIN
jgi:hypothetical protein